MNTIKRLFKALFNATLAPVLALVLIFEEWGWEPLQRLMARLARLPVWSQIENLIRRLPPYAALLAFFVPMLLLLPVKLLALFWISHGHPLLGLCLVLIAKVTGTAIVARLFSLTQPALMQLPWFANLYGRWVPWKDALIAQVKNSATWRTAAASVRSIRKWLGF